MDMAISKIVADPDRVNADDAEVTGGGLDGVPVVIVQFGATNGDPDTCRISLTRRAAYTLVLKVTNCLQGQELRMLGE